MSSDFTYAPPDDKKYFIAVLRYLERSGNKEVVDLLRGCSCSIRSSGNFSRKRWNAYYTEIMFYVPLEKLDLVTDEIKHWLLMVCDKIMPAEVGLDVMNVDFAPIFDHIENEPSIVEELKEVATKISQPSLIQLPNDILRKGQEMSEVYLYLYAVENSLRLFIEKVGQINYGPKYFEKLTIPAQVKKGIQARKEQEGRNQWLRIRGESNIFYIDFKDLGIIILNNWDIFRHYFPDQAWISTKIEELGNCRNLVAHNSYVDDHEKDLIRVYYTSIIKQINSSAFPNDEPPPF